jgi:uncharacterized protein (TIGR02145 family)
MAENLNYAVCGSKCGGVTNSIHSYPFLEDANTENCDKYGRLYDWATALTVCPDGWHLPSDEEWNVLVKYVDPNWVSHTNNVAGTKLKATSGWVLDRWIYNCRENVAAKMIIEDNLIMESYIPCGINGTDDYDFSALPGGYGSNNRFYGFISIGYWWGATESPGNGGRFAYYQGVYNDTGYAYGHGYVKASFLSVRCVRD